MGGDPGSRGSSLTFSELQALVLKKKEVWISRVLYRKFSVPITYLLLRTPLTPNGATWLSAIVGIGALAGIANPWSRTDLILAGLLLFQLSIILDHVDGELARAKRMPSAGGWFLDNFVMEVFLHIGLAVAFPLLVFFELHADLWLVVGAAFLVAKSLNLTTFFLKGVSHLRTARAADAPSAPAAASETARPGLLHLVGARYWEVKKFANFATLLILMDLVLRVRGVALSFDQGRLPFTLLGAFLAFGVPWLSLSLLLDVIGASRGRLALDFDPYH